jgi:hypothetical protein
VLRQQLSDPDVVKRALLEPRMGEKSRLDASLVKAATHRRHTEVDWTLNEEMLEQGPGQCVRESLGAMIFQNGESLTRMLVICSEILGAVGFM